MSDHYAKNCDIQTITPQDLSPVAIFIAQTTINQMSAMCVDYLTEQLAKSYMDKFGVVMEGQDRKYLKALAHKKCADFLNDAAKSIATQLQSEKKMQLEINHDG